MGYTSYSVSDRSLRASTMEFTTKGIDQIFEQNTKRAIHQDMSPIGLKFRECFDSDIHPNTIPIILSLDVTGSMRKIPHELIKTGLPTLMGNLTQRGIPDASLLFLAVGDHECDRCPLQVAQFESGDAELDLWLTRNYLEGGGGGNDGESYLLAHYVAAFHTKTDAFDKRGKKGYLITVGDEPGLKSLPKNAIDGIIGAGSQKSWTDLNLLSEAQKMYHVYHINIDHRGDRSAGAYWKQLLGENCITITDHTQLPEVIAEIILKNEPAGAPVGHVEGAPESSKEDIKITL